MLVVEGFYENGKVEFYKPPVALNEQKVLVSFPENEEDEQRLLSLQQESIWIQDYLLDKSEDLYQDFL